MDDSLLSKPDAADAAAIRRAYRCRCGKQVFFRNSRCLTCDAPLGYIPSQRSLSALIAGAEPGTWQKVAAGPTSAATAAPVYRRCGNFDSPAACNWLIEPNDDAGRSTLCKACRLNRTIPDLSQTRNAPLWLCLERAKRRLVSQLIGLGLPVASKVAEDPERGLAYDFLQSMPDGPRVMTGYANGVITINVEEADDAVREQTRLDMGEPYRTLLGHFRHESGHYYWDRLIAGSPLQAGFRQLFGDERHDYAAALNVHYVNGAPTEWTERFVSAYASVHPSEDWAESWAHYLHVRDTLDTAASFGIVAKQVDIESVPFNIADLWHPEAPNATAFLEMLRRWVLITGVMNEMSRAMGQHDFYPFVLPRSAVAKLHFIHCAISDFSAHAAVDDKELA